METIIKIDQETITLELANAIAAFNITKVAELLSDPGEYCIQDEKEKTVLANKTTFLAWLSNCFDEYLSANDDCDRLNYIVDRCSYCRIGNPVIIFEDGKFPVITRNSWEREKCGLMLEFDGNMISDISFCYLFLTTDNLFHFEKKCKRQID
jgi:hypothetical protein